MYKPVIISDIAALIYATSVVFFFKFKIFGTQALMYCTNNYTILFTLFSDTAYQTGAAKLLTALELLSKTPHDKSNSKTNTY